ncbi:Hypothetical protein D9617_1g088490 [Elsinoe fawcettii]|nr:Hypothetical protein D9617_1g088490 [Elsinoe fawcettii]
MAARRADRTTAGSTPNTSGKKTARAGKAKILEAPPPDFVGNIVKVLVGPKKQPIFVHETHLGRNSGYMKACLRGKWTKSDDKIVTLEETDPQIFGIWARYVYTGQLQYLIDETTDRIGTNHATDRPEDDQGKGKTEGSQYNPLVQSQATKTLLTSCTTTDVEWPLLIDLYVLSHFLMDFPFCNRVIDKMLDKYRANGEWPCSHASLVFSETGPDTPLRHLITDFHVHLGLGKQVKQEVFENCMADQIAFLETVMEGVADLKWSKWEHEWLERPEPWDTDGCRYHIHRDEAEKKQCEKKGNRASKG